MKLILDIIKHPQEKILKRNFHFNQTNSTVGRDENLENRLIDNKNIVSSNHFNIHFKNGEYYIEDVSTNGTFLKHPFKRLPKNALKKINNSDIFILGEYELQARFIDDEYSTNEKYEQDQLIPDDFLLDDNEIMDSSMIDEEYDDFETPNSVLDMFEEEEETTLVETVYEEENKVHDDILDNHIDVDTYKHKETIEEEIIVEKNNSEIDMSNILSNKLGIEFENLSKNEKENVLNEICDIVINSLEGLKHALLVKDKITKDLKVDEQKLHINENPIKMGQLALNVMDINDTQKVNLSEAVSKSFKELNTHNIALHRTSKNLVHITANKFSPKDLEYYFEKNNQINKLLPKNHQLWNCYTNMFNNFDKDKKQAQDMIMDDFINEYKNILYTIKLTSA
ncbi:type VI secretion system-associated FHA domain protein TagH [Malaciobacter molluscorum LMG 25693]|uniref:Type VI secretion system-associated FHA domain protein TagH n=1 Tax=Malaciobacter molluscorum LMG 25693 TaxID=870501 RepID=A0A2G1DI08_9BACT|nr:type VI secretion system-associated FHA domain protein TagH [Malaciobacter molluscorum]AXX92437.1 type VI secretion system-associated FHA domain-containing protein TagH [Malaciobacter molluscorum LMG 25693]PHO18117.1 type VI secretion system-associated FHA domain protein TagH [Malaciobacter molluscorum LMG 25693]